MKRTVQNTLVGLLLAGAALSLSAQVASARGPAGPGGPGGMMEVEFSELDANGDGAVTIAELQAQGAARFMDADTDTSGTLDKNEVIAMIENGIKTRMADHEAQPGRPERDAPDAARIAWMADGAFLKFDTDGDALLTASEMQIPEDRLNRLMSRLDTDGDSQISEAEFDAAKSHRGGRGRP